MSDNRRRYRAIVTKLKQLYPEAKRRKRQYLVLLAVAVMAAGVTISALAAGKTLPPEQDLAATATQSALKQRALQATLTAQAQPPTATRTPTPPPTRTPTPSATPAPTLPPTSPPTATPTAIPTVTPTATPTRMAPPATRAPAAQPASPMAEALVRGLNIRSGPGTGYAIIGNASAGQSFPVTGQNGDCAWLQVLLEDGGNGWISGAPAYSSLNVPCRTLRAAAAPAQAAAAPVREQLTATPRPTRALAVVPTPSPAIISNAVPAAAEPRVLTSFEPLGNWQRGDEAYGTLQQSSEQALSGAASAELAYDFPAEAGSSNYVVFLPRPSLRIPAGAEGLQIQVYGDGSGNFLNAWVADSAGQTWQLTFGRIYHTGWAPMSLALAPSRDRPNGPIGDAASDELTEPLAVNALVLDGAADGVESSGVIYLDELSSY